MKTLTPLFLALLGLMPLMAQDADPTQPSPRMRSAMMAKGSSIPALAVKGVVMGRGKKGVVMLEAAGPVSVVARPEVPFNLVVGGVSVQLVVKSISTTGIEIENADAKETVMLPSSGAIEESASVRPDADIAYIEFRDASLMDALRMIADQSGNNYSTSSAANKTPVSAFLRHISAENAVEEICKSHSLWFKKDEASGITRIMGVSEFEKDLVGFREEQTEVFTLQYPNVNEVAYAIADLYSDRVEFSFGADESDEDMRRDLEGRFDRFDVLTQRTQQANSMSGNILGSSVNGFVSNGGGISGFGGYGGGSGGGDEYGSNSRGRFGENRSSNSRYNRRDENQRDLADDQSFRGLTSEQAARVAEAMTRPLGAGAADVEALRQRPASIYVTASRRNNMVVVRTADTQAMEEIRKLVTKLDVQTPMVLLEVKVVSIELGNDFRSAFDYQYSDGGTSGSFTRENIALPLDGGAFAGAGFNSSDMTFTIVSDNFRARMQIFEELNRIKTIATPTLLTTNNEVSRIFLGEERPLVRNISSQTIITDNNVATTPNTQTEFRNVGNTLLITPNINSDRTVTLRLVQENSNINPDAATIPVVSNDTNGGTTVEDVAVDTVATRSISGTFMAKDGMTIAAGGLIEDVDNKRRGQVPVLGRIPVLGFFFQRREEAKSRRELVVIIRPYVLSTPADGERISRDLLDRLAPKSVDRLVGEGFLPALLPPPPPEPESRPPPSAAASKKLQPAPIAPAPKKTSLFRKISPAK